MSAPPPFRADLSIPARLDTQTVDCCVCGPVGHRAVATTYDYEYRTSRQSWTYVRCDGCGLVYLRERPATSELARIYPPHYYSFDEAQRDQPLVAALRGRLESAKAAAFAAHVPKLDARVLDVGCGDGRFLSVLKRAGPPGWRLEGLDIDVGAVERARSRGLKMHHGRLEDFEAPAGGYDLVVLMQVLEHVADPRDTCRRIHRLLAPGGVFVVETPAVAGWDERLFRDGLWGGYHVPRHWNLFTPTTLGRLLNEEGFEVKEQRPLISTSFWINSLYNRALVHGASPRHLGFLHYQNPALLALFLPLDRLAIALGRRTSNQRVVARRASGSLGRAG